MIKIPKPKNPNRNKAFEVYEEKEGKIKAKDLANLLNENINNIRTWKSLDKWDYKIGKNKKVGAPKGNKNSLGNKGGAPKENFNAVKHGQYIPDSRFTKGNLNKILPKTIVNTIIELEKESAIDKLWRSILIQEARILNMQKITYVKNKKDTSKVLKKHSKGKINTEEYEIQFAWDKENNSVTALSKAMDTLTKMIDKYDKMIHANWDLVTEEQKARIELIKAQINKITGDNQEIEDTSDIESEIYGD